LNHDEALTLLHREPLDVFLLEKFENITLGSIELSYINAHQMDDKVHILPHVVVVLNMYIESFFSLTIKGLPINVADKAHIIDIIVGVLFVFSQQGESVDDNTEDDVQENRDHDDEKAEIEDLSEVEALDVVRRCCLIR